MCEVARAFIEEARSHLIAEYLSKIERCLERLSEEQVWWRPNEQSNSAGNLLLHLEGNARQWIVCGVGGGDDHRARDLEFKEREQLPRTELMGRLRDTLFEVDGVLARLDPAALLQKRRIQGLEVTVLAAVFHVVEHFSMHTGQIIQLTKLLTGSDLNFYDFAGGVPRPNWKE